MNCNNFLVKYAGYVCAKQAGRPTKCWGENLRKIAEIGNCSKSLPWGLKKWYIMWYCFSQLIHQNFSAFSGAFPGWTLTSVSSNSLWQDELNPKHIWEMFWQVSKEFMMSPNKLHLECSLDKELYYHGETISVNVHIQASHIIISPAMYISLCQKNNFGFGSSGSEGSFRVVRRTQKTSFKFIDP